MTDVMESAARSALMARIRSKNTKPEMVVRRALHRLGYRYRLHCSGLPGRPDIVFPRKRKVIFIHGCFWHRHPSCSKAYVPKTRQNFWEAKFEENVERDKRAIDELRGDGWSVFVVWECELVRLEETLRLIVEFLGAPKQGANCSHE